MQGPFRASFGFSEDDSRKFTQPSIQTWSACDTKLQAIELIITYFRSYLIKSERNFLQLGSSWNLEENSHLLNYSIQSTVHKFWFSGNSSYTNKWYGHTAHTFSRLLCDILIWDRFISISSRFQMNDTNTFLAVSPADLITKQQKQLILFVKF